MKDVLSDFCRLREAIELGHFQHFGIEKASFQESCLNTLLSGSPVSLNNPLTAQIFHAVPVKVLHLKA